MAESRRARIYGRDVQLPDVVAVDLPDAETSSVDLRIVLERGVGSPAVHETGMLLWVEPGLVRVEVPDSYGPLATEHLILDHAVPIGLSASGDLVIHGAGLALDGAGMLLCGPSGQGKSVTSTYLRTRGWRLLSDDAVRLELVGSNVVMWPSYEGVRLHEASFSVLGPDIMPDGLVAEYGTKRRVAGDGSFTTSPNPLSLVVSLGRSTPEMNARVLGAAELLSVVATSTFDAAADVSEATSRLESVIPFVEQLRGVEITYPRTADQLPNLELKLHELL